MVIGLETASGDSWHYMVKEEESRGECVPFRMLNPACGSFSASLFAFIFYSYISDVLF